MEKKMKYWLMVLLILASSAQADITRTHASTSTFLGTNETKTTDYYAGDRSASESTTKWTKGFMKTVTRGKPVESTTIIRLDKELVWTLDTKKKTYQEMTFAEFKELLEKGMTDMEEAPADTTEETVEPDREDNYDWTVEDVSSPDPKTINGWLCRNAHIVATGTHKEDPKDIVSISIDTWNSEDVPGAEEIADFNMRYMKALGLDERMLTPGLLQIAQLYQDKMSALIEAAKKAPGEPVESAINIQHNRKKGKSVGEAIGEGAANEMLKKVPFGIGKKKSEKEPVYEMKTVFSIENKLSAATQGAVEGSVFEIPDGYKK
jgi:hypothetical protein